MAHRHHQVVHSDGELSFLELKKKFFFFFFKKKRALQKPRFRNQDFSVPRNRFLKSTVTRTINSVHKQLIILALFLQKSVCFKHKTGLIRNFHLYPVHLTNESNVKCWFCSLIGFQFPSKCSLMKIRS